MPNQFTDFSQFGEAMPNSPWNEDVQELSKALTAGTDINTPGAVAGSGFALRPESLDGTLYNLTYGMKHLQLWPQLLKEDVLNTVNEHNTLVAHGSGQAFFHSEGDLPGEDDSTWQRNYTIVRAMGCTRKYSIMASLTRMAHNNAETHQTLGGTMWILEQLEKALFAGNNTLLSQSFDGYDVQIAHSRDLRGRPLTGEEVNYGAGLIFDAPNYGQATDIYMPVGVDTDLIDDIAPNARYAIGPQGYQNGHAGMQIKVYDTQRGPIALHPDVFVTFGAAPSAVALGAAATRPAAPTESVGLNAAGSGSQFEASDVGAYYYKVVAVNAYGKSAPLTLSGTVTPTAGQQVTFTVSAGSPAPAYYEVYRSTKGGAASTCKYAFKVAAGVTTTVITDTNAYIPGTATVYLVQQNREFNVFNRLLRFMKVRLGMVDSSYRFMLLLYGNLIVHCPNKALKYINVGRASRSPSYDVA
jgi:hypothetical protein